MSHGADCPACGEALESPLGCRACGGLFAPEAALDPFIALGLEPQFALDADALKKRLVRFGRLFHPDFHANDPAAREQAERCTAELNSAYELVADDARRADHLVRQLGGPDQETERQMPQVFLMEVLEWNEVLEDAEGAAPSEARSAQLDGLEVELSTNREQTLAAVAAALTPLPESGAAVLVDVRRQLNALRYLDRALGTLRELRLASPPTLS